MWVEAEEEVVDVVVIELRSARTDTFDPLPSEVRFQCDKWREEGKSKTYGLSSRHQHFSLNGCRACSAVARWRRRLFQPDFCKWPTHPSLCAVVKQKDNECAIVRPSSSDQQKCELLIARRILDERRWSTQTSGYM